MKQLAGAPVQHSDTTARGLALAALRHPSLWAWPLAAWLTLRGMYSGSAPLDALERYYAPALGLLLLGCVPSFFEREPSLREPDPPFLSRRVLAWLTVAVLAAAVAVRCWRLWEWPPNGIGFEEFQIGARGDMGPHWARNLLVAYGQPGEHTLTAYAISLAFALFGTGFLEMRLAFIVTGILCPFLLYAVCRRLVAWEVSLFTVALFAVSWWQIAASRVADEIFFPMWTELAILWLLIHFEDTGRTWAGFLLALLSGLLIYEYTSYHLVPVLVIGYLAARILLFAARVLLEPPPARGRLRLVADGVRTYGRGAKVMVLVWIIVAHFQLVADVRRGMGSWFAGGVGGHASDPDGLLAQLNAPGSLPAFVLRKLEIPVRAAYQPGHGDFCLFTGLGGQPAFDLATAIALGVGIVLVAATFWRRFHALALLWAGLVVGGAALLPANANLHRYYTGLPVFYLIIALGAEVLWRWLRQPAARYALLGVFALAAAYAAVSNVHYLFWEMVPSQTLRAAWIWPRTEVVNWVRAHRRDDWICIVTNDDRSIYGPNPLQPEWRFLVEGWNVRVSGSGADCIPANEAGPGGRYYLFALPDPPIDLEALLRQHYPNAQELAPITVPLHQFTARTFYVPPPTS